jgi:hypothetical protein
MLVGAQLALPDAVTADVRAGRPETGAAAEKAAVAQDQNAAVAALHAVEHMHVERIEPVFHGPRISPAVEGVETAQASGDRPQPVPTDRYSEEVFSRGRPKRRQRGAACSPSQTSAPPQLRQPK